MTSSAKPLDASDHEDLATRIEVASEVARRDPDDLVLRLRLQRLLVRSGAPDAFEDDLDRCLESARRRRLVDPRTVSALLTNIHASASAERVHPRLHRLLAIAARSERTAPLDAAMTRARTLLALRDEEAFIAATSNLRPLRGRRANPMVRRLLSVAEAWSSPRHPDLTRAPIFVIGLSRTGTLSTHAALTTLGLSSLHWRNDLTGDLITDDDLVLFDAFSDIGISGRFEQLAEMFPAARFIWTVRPVDSWIRSVTRHYLRNCGFDAPHHLLDGRFTGAFRGGRGRVEAAVYSHHPTFEAAYTAHARRVERFFDDGVGHRLLRLPVTEGAGWGPLCAFLGVPVPPQPFPHLHRSRQSTRSLDDGP